MSISDKANAAKSASIRLTAVSSETKNNALADIGKFTRATRSYILFLKEDKTLVDCSYEWYTDGKESKLDSFQNLSVDMFPCWQEKITALRRIFSFGYMF